jgi:hypothetical protein
MPVSAGNKQHKKQSGVLTHREYKQKLLQDPDVKREYDALEDEYQREVAKIKKNIANR